MYIYRTLVQRCTQLCIYDITLHGSHVYRVPWAVTVYWCGLATAGVICYVMLCYVGIRPTFGFSPV